VSGGKKLAALQQATIYALPSLSENFGIAAVEALAAGAPCVLAHGVAIAAEIAAAGGCLCPADTDEAWADALANLALNPERRAALSQAGRAFAQATYTMDAMGARLEKLYKEVLIRAGKRIL
jgi:glycosyltransferase involved in cell wall biosynthesis